MLPIVFLTAASLMLVLVLFAFWQSVRALFGRGVDEVAAAVGGDRAALLDEKGALLRGLKDLEFERALGKVSEADHARLEASYRARAKSVLAELDRDLGPWREKAEQLARTRVPASGGAGAAAQADTAQADTAQADTAQADTAQADTAKDDAPKDAASKDAAPKNNAAGDASAKDAAAGGGAARLRCARCGALNEPDAVFCKKCAAPLASPGVSGDAEGGA